MMKIYLIIICIVIGMLTSHYIAYRIGYSHIVFDHESASHGNNECFKEDYPLIDIYCDKRDGHKWTLIIREHIEVNEHETFRMITDADALHWNQEYLSVLTFPMGRGTTPNGSLYLYRDNTLIKEVQFVDSTDIHIQNKSLEKYIRSVSYTEVKQRIHGVLPDPW